MVQHPQSGGDTKAVAVGWWMVICLTILSMLAQIDKTVLTLLVAPIKADLGLSDTEMGLVVGLAFAVANFSVALPAGWLADKFSRRSMIAGGVALWSGMAVLCGTASSFLGLFLARMGVGLGEGVIPPPSYSLVRDGVAQKHHGRAFSLYGAAASCGAGLSLILGGILLGLITSRGWSSLPLIGEAAPWQICLILIGLAGLPLALLPFAFPDPGREKSDQSQATFAKALAEMGRQSGVMTALAVFSVCHAMLAASLAMWAPTMLMRNFGMTPPEVGASLGAMLLVIAPVGLLTAGAMMDYLSRKSPSGPAVVAIAASAVLAIAAVSAPQAQTLPAFWICQAFVVASSTIYLPVTSTIVARAMPSLTIGKTMALFLFLQGVCGAGLAPVIAGWVGDTFFPGEARGLANALSVVAVAYGLIALVAAVALNRFLRGGKLAAAAEQIAAAAQANP